MLKLLHANMARLIKSVTFWICISLYALYPIIVALIESGIDNSYFISDELLSYNYGGFMGLPLQGMLIALLCAVVFSSDFQNGTLRNKIALGHSRSNIYLSNLLTMMIIALALDAVYLLAFFTVGRPLLGSFTLPASEIIGIIVNGSLMLLAYSSIYVFIVMTCKNPIASTIISIVVLAAGAGLAFGMWDIARIPSHITQDRYNGIGEFVETVTIPWDGYPGKAAHDFCQFIADFLPSGQSCQTFFDVRDREYIYHWQYALYSLVWILAPCGAGIAMFKKSDIK